ncbi:tetratricopeptide repeat protein [Beggiatoa alba B18LD]|uniref:Tetratricopeptide repeat protein n=1 Tax=Beggiatoa alba B18LD TaxID=395493 RepID=I3CKU8_9GAMM|nr:tetratricopeptide repeat protein [Beggiatoa alba]EIJ44241.1 tetratricopeptide repeat protein [Beggiatoa alba B18LD]
MRICGWLGISGLMFSMASFADMGDDLIQAAEQALIQQNQLQAEEKYQQALNYYTQQAENQAKQINVLLQLSILAYQQGEFSKAIPLLKKAVSLCEVIKNASVDCFAVLHNLGATYQAQGENDLAEPFYHQLLTLQIAKLGENARDIIPTLNALASLSYQLGRYPQAQHFYQRLLSLQEIHQQPVLATLEALAELAFTRFKDLSTAQKLYERVLTLQTVDGESLAVTNTLNLLGLIAFQQQDYAKAEPLYQQALALREKLLGREHADVAVSLNNLAKLYATQGQYEKAKPLYIKAITILEQQEIPNNPILRKVKENLQNLLVQQSQ